MTDTKQDPALPPLPTGLPTYEFPDGSYSGEDMQAYGRACYEKARADLIAEQPAARAEPSDDELSALYLFADRAPFYAWLREARALLARYGAQPAIAAAIAQRKKV